MGDAKRAYIQPDTPGAAPDTGTESDICYLVFDSSRSGLCARVATAALAAAPLQRRACANAPAAWYRFRPVVDWTSPLLRASVCRYPYVCVRRQFDTVAEYCYNFSHLIPLSFVLGFYVTHIWARFMYAIELL